jgi:hypothetical protein
LSDAWNNPLISAHLSKSHEQSILSLCSSKPLKSKRRTYVPDPDNLAPEVAALQKDLDEVKLSSWKYVCYSVTAVTVDTV